MSKYIEQAIVERTYSKKHIRERILEEVSQSEFMMERVAQGVSLLEEYLAGDYYDSKNQRLSELEDTDLEYLVHSVLALTLPITVPERLGSVAGQLAPGLGYSDERDAVITAAEILAVLADMDTFDIFKPDSDELGRIYLGSRFKPTGELAQFLHQTKYLPPMICEPQEAKRNFANVHLTFAESLILGKGNHHNGNICLDSINKFNRVPLTLNVEMLTAYSEEPSEKIRDKIKSDSTLGKQWEKMVKDSYQVYLELVKHGNKFWLTHKVDKRGRTYSQGYHCSYQGNSFRKSIVDFWQQEVVDVPEEYRI